MRVTNALLRAWAYLFHLAVSAILLSLAILARTYHQQLNLEILPFSSASMISRATMLSLGGFLCVILAAARMFEVVFPLWSLAVTALLAYGLFFGPYQFTGPHGLAQPLVLLAAAILASVGAILVPMPRRRRRGRW